MTMMLRLTSDEMLRIWRECAGLEPLNADCTIERFDGIDLDSMIRRRMRLWYLALLDEGRPEMTGAPADATGLLTLGDGGLITAAPEVRRVVSLQLSSWARGVTVRDADDVAGRLHLEANPYSAAGPLQPAAWRDSGGIIRVAPYSASDSIAAAAAYADTGEDLYVLDERAISTIPTINLS